MPALPDSTKDRSTSGRAVLDPANQLQIRGHAPQTTPTVLCMDSLFLLDHVIYIIVITVLAITIIILAVCVCRLKEKRNRHLSSKRNISTITTSTPSLLLAPSGSKDNTARLFDISDTKRVVENGVYIHTTLPKLASTHASGNYSNGSVANSNHTSTLSSGSRKFDI